ncbi:MAG TPA: glycosyltransferase family 2 protein [Thermoanaerobaculia bacterium]
MRAEIVHPSLQASGSAPAVSAVVPVYNSEATLAELVRRLTAALEGAAAGFEILLVNDGSRDGSWEAIAALAAADPRVRGVDLMRNYGQHNALLCGIRTARGEVIVTLDDDLQHPPEEIPRLLAALDARVDAVYGTPLAGQHGLWRDVASTLTKQILQGAMGAAVARQVSAFRAFRTPLREAFAQYANPYLSLDVLLTWATTRFAAVPVRFEPRRSGESNYTFGMLVRHAVNMVTGFSVLPLQAASLVGFATMLFGLGVLAWAVGRYFLLGTSVPGFPFLASVISIFAGAQLFTLGVIGEYLARVHLQIMARPVYAVRSATPEPPARAGAPPGPPAAGGPTEA